MPNGPRRSLASDRGRWVRLAALLVIAALLYLPRLDRVPLHLGYDEIFFGLHAHALAETGHDANGRLLPLYLQAFPSANYWIQPAAPYLTALFLQVLPLSDSAIRLPTVMLGLVNVVLVYFIAWRLFGRELLALVAAALLVVTPAHLIHSRLGVDYLYPLPFVLTWVLCLLIFLERRQAAVLFAGTSALGLGFYSYVASVVMMPIYVGLTCLFLWWDREPRRSYVIAFAGFAWPLLLLPLFLLAHPEVIDGFRDRYGFRSVSPGSKLNAAGRLLDVLNTRTIQDRLSVYYNFFSPEFLFVSGGNNVTNSTRQAGVFLAPLAPFFAVGLYDAATRWTRHKALVVLGFLTAPVAAIIIVENYAVDRALGLLPFGVLLATFGLVRMWEASCRRAWRPFWVPAGLALVLVGLAYQAWKLVTAFALSGPSLALVAGGALVLATGYATERLQRWWPLAMALLLMALAQYPVFYRDYFGDYAARASPWFGNNIRGAIERVVALHDEQPAPAVYLSADIQHVISYWQFYLQMRGRDDLIPRGVVFKIDELDADAIPAGSLVVVGAQERPPVSLVERGAWREVATATDPNEFYSLLGPGQHVTLVIYRRQASAGH